MDSEQNEALSFRNPKVQQLRRLIGRRSSRTEHGKFVFEGPTLLAEALAAGFPIDTVFVDADAADRLVDAVRALAARDVEVLRAGRGRARQGRGHRDAAGDHRRRATADPSMSTAFVTERPHGLIVVLERLGDPGNAGAIVRTAEAVGATAVVFGAGSTDPYGPKTVRAAAGSAFRVPLVAAGTTVDALEALAGAGFARGGHGCDRWPAVRCRRPHGRRRTRARQRGSRARSRRDGEPRSTCLHPDARTGREPQRGGHRGGARI